MVLASDSALIFVRGIFGLFLLRGVEGMPPVDPDSSMGKAIARGDKNVSKYMPPAWGSHEILRFKGQVLKVLTKYSKNPALMQDVLMDAFEALMKNNAWERIDPTRGLASAKSFVLQTIARTAINRWRGTPDEVSLTMEDEDGGSVESDIPDLDASDVDHMMDLRMVSNLLDDAEVQADLETVHPDALLFIKLLLDGLTQKEILGNPPKGIPSMLPNWTYGPSAWQPKPERGYTTNILRVLRNHALSNEGRGSNIDQFHF